MEATSKYGPELAIMYADVGASINTDVSVDGAVFCDSWGFGNRSGFCVLFDELRMSGHLHAPFKVRDMHEATQQLPSCMQSPAREKKQASHVSFAVADILVPPTAMLNTPDASVESDQNSDMKISSEKGDVDTKVREYNLHRDIDLIGPTKLKLSLDNDGSSGSTLADLARQMDDILVVAEVIFARISISDY